MLIARLVVISSTEILEKPSFQNLSCPVEKIFSLIISSSSIVFLLLETYFVSIVSIWRKIIANIHRLFTHGNVLCILRFQYTKVADLCQEESLPPETTLEKNRILVALAEYSLQLVSALTNFIRSSHYRHVLFVHNCHSVIFT